MARRFHEAANIIREDPDHRYECQRCGWPAVHIGGNRFKHACSGTTGPAPCNGYPEAVIPRGSHREAIRKALGR